MAARIVVDTSVLIKWFKTRDEEMVDEARRLLAEIEARSIQVHVPALLLYEIGNILLLKTRLDAAGLGNALAHLASLPLTIAPPVTPLLMRAAALGHQLGLTFYDASFLALAAELDCVCITADRGLSDRARRFPGIRHLSRVGALLS